jgi:hypothetical protein
MRLNSPDQDREARLAANRRLSSELLQFEYPAQRVSLQQALRKFEGEIEETPDSLNNPAERLAFLSMGSIWMTEQQRLFVLATSKTHAATGGEARRQT